MSRAPLTPAEAEREMKELSKGLEKLGSVITPGEYLYRCCKNAKKRSDKKSKIKYHLADLPDWINKDIERILMKGSEAVLKEMNGETGNIDSLVVKCIIETMGKNPLAFIPIIQTIMDPKNPDSDRLTREISKSLTDACITDKEFKQRVGQQILDMINQTTSEQVIGIVNQQRLSLSKDSKKYLEHIARETMVSICEKYFEIKKKEIDKIFNDYFKELKNYIETQIDKTHEKVQKEIKESREKNTVSVEIPADIKDDILKYALFLQKK